MGLTLGRRFVEKIRDNVRQNNLAENELRLIEGASPMRIARSSAEVDTSAYMGLFELKIDGICYTIFDPGPPLDETDVTSCSESN